MWDIISGQQTHLRHYVKTAGGGGGGANIGWTTHLKHIRYGLFTSHVINV